MCLLAWLRPHAWPASPRDHMVATKTPSPSLPRASPSTAMSSISAFTRSMSAAAFSLFTPLPAAASFFFLFSCFFFSFFLFFSSFFVSFFLLFLSCSEESVASSLEESAAGREAG